MKILLRCQFRFRKKAHNRFPTLNEYIDCERGSTIAAAAMKKKCTEQVKEQCLSQQIESVKGKAAGVLENDNRKFIGTMADEVVNDDDDFVIVHITEHMSIFLQSLIAIKIKISYV